VLEAYLRAAHGRTLRGRLAAVRYLIRTVQTPACEAGKARQT